MGDLLGVPGKLLGIPGGSSGAHGGSLEVLGGVPGGSRGVFGGPQGEKVSITWEIEHFDVPKISFQGGSRNTRWAFLLIRMAKIEAFQ